MKELPQFPGEGVGACDGLQILVEARPLCAHPHRNPPMDKTKSGPRIQPIQTGKAAAM